MLHESIQPRDNGQGFIADWIPLDTNAVQFNPNFADVYGGMINNQFPMGYGVVKLNDGVNNNNNPMVSHEVIPMNLGYTGYNSVPVNMSNHQYFGGSSINNVAGTNMFSNNGMSVTQAFDGITRTTVTRGSYMHSVGQSYNMGLPMSANNVQPNIFGTMYNNTQGLNCGTYLRPPDYVPGQWVSQHSVKDQSNRFKIPRVSSWQSVTGRAEESSSHSCNDLNCGIRGPATFDMMSRKRKYHVGHPGDESLSAVMESRKQSYPFEPVNDESWVGDGNGLMESKRQRYDLGPISNYESWVGSGTLMDVLISSCLPVDLPPLEQWPKSSEDVSGPDSMASGPGPDVTSGTLMDVYSSFMKSYASTKDAKPDNEDASGLEVNNVPDDSGPKVICGLNSALDDYGHVLESMQSIQPSVLEPKMTTGQITPVEDNGPEVEPTNVMTPSVVLVDSFEDNGPEVEPANVMTPSVVLVDSFEDNGPEMEPANVKMPSVPLANSFPYNGPELEPANVKEPSLPLGDSFQDNGSGPEATNIKKPSASLADSFTAGQIKEHLSSFIQPKNDTSAGTTFSESQNPCQLCSKYKLLLSPTPVYCSSCDLRVKKNVKYYRSTDENNTQHFICMCCFKGSRGSTITTRVGSVSKANLYIIKNDEEIEDSWVQCDKCQHWQHRICGLYNNETDLEGRAEYVCPKCCLKEMENGTRIALPKNVTGAKDLPRTNLSDHIEQRVFTRMKQEREETAKFHGIPSEKVPVAEGLVVRVVVSVDKELEVKKEFRDIFNGQDYPEKMEYRSKFILLFQKIGGVDVCLFGMYVQEFGSECNGPNNRCVYMSYIDSVKYFQPERKTLTGEPLRTFVYHEILIGYLEHCKKRGFASCYIWSCPLIKGEDYIFYCHPKTQKTPEKTKLRQWYKLMIQKAMKDGIAVDQANLYNEFFTPSDVKISASRLPYFSGDCWTDAAENISKKLDEEERSGESVCVKSRTKRILMANGQERLTKDTLVMHKLGEVIMPHKENYMIIRLQHTCTSCNEVILSGSRWFCNLCNKIQLCSRCVCRVHTCGSCKDTPLSKGVTSVIPVDTKDNDDMLINKFFDTRDDFLNKCQNSRYQFDTLGHAKYSSMMILYHFKYNLVVQPQGDTCQTPVSAEVTPETRKKQPQSRKANTLKRSLHALTHACQCKSVDGCYPDCKTVKTLLQHFSICTNKQSGCQMCGVAWWILKNHINASCTDLKCIVPYCTDIRRKRATRARDQISAK